MSDKCYRIPWVEWPLIYDIRARPYAIHSETGTKDLQMVNLGLRILFRPNSANIPWLAKNVGPGKFQKFVPSSNYKISTSDFDDKILPSITNETLKSVIANFNAAALLTRRNEVRKYPAIVVLFTILF